MSSERFYEAQVAGQKRCAPAASRNREPIAQVLKDWLPRAGLVLEVASGTGEHVVHFARSFSRLWWQPSDINLGALASITAWLEDAGLPNVRPPLVLDCASSRWPVESADAVLSINMVHISPWASALGLINGASRILRPRAPLILYGPWLKDDVDLAPSNRSFDAELRLRNSEWGLRRVEDFAGAAKEGGLELMQTRQMPSNNMMLLFERR